MPDAPGRSVPTARLLVVSAVALLAAGCSSGASSPTPSPTPPPAATSSAAPSAPATCPDGSYLITGFEGRGNASAAGKGTGGNITADFTGGTYSIASDGTGPVKLAIGPVSAEMRFNGQITGTYAGDPSALQLTTTGAHGDATVKGFGVSHSYSAGGLANQLIGSSATAQVTCDDAAGTMTVVLPNAQLTLARR